jgi:cysteine desulfurase/selenocysteine lyase
MTTSTTTSDKEPRNPLSSAQPPGNPNSGDMLDPEVIGRIANELYHELSKALATGVPESLAAREEEHLRTTQVGGKGSTETPADPSPMTYGDLDDGLRTGEVDLRDTFADTEPSNTTSLRQRVSLQRFYFLPDSAPPVTPTGASHIFHVQRVRRDFPALNQKVHGKPLIWLDNAATSQKPQSVIDAMVDYYKRDNSNVHRGVHSLAERATDAYEGAREKVRQFLGAGSAREIIFVRGATEGINLVAQTYGRKYVESGDEIVLSTLEHHSNIVPWQLLCQEKDAVLRVAPINDRGEIILEEYEKLLGPRTRLVAISHVSNSLGTIIPVRAMTEMARRYGAHVLVDGAQAIPHFRVNVQALNSDFYVFSGHKLFGPTGIGVLYGKADLLEDMPPWQGGGSMIDTVTFEKTTYNQIPYKFEAGTPIIAGAVGLGAAIDYLNQIGFEAAAAYEQELMSYAMDALAAIPGLRQIGTSEHKIGVLSFILEGIRPEDLGAYLDREGIAVRAGHHCAQPTMKRFNVTSTVRPSLALYNTCEEIDALAAAITRAKKFR